MTKSFVIYDLETLRIPYTGGTTKKPNVEYANGWRDYKGLGVSVLTCYCSRTGYHAFLASQLLEFEAIAHQSDEVVGFNSSRFDDLVLKELGISVTTTYDLLLECWAAAGLDSSYSFPSSDPPEVRAKYAGFKLEDLAKANLPRGKKMSGELAPERWQRGDYKPVIEYCFDDVDITKQVLQFGLQGRLWHAATRQFLKLRRI